MTISEQFLRPTVGRGAQTGGTAIVNKRPKILFLQTQAENAGAQEITRVLGEGLAPKGYDIHHMFFYRKTETFEAPPNTVFCEIDRPGTPWAFAKFLFKLVKLLREMKPDVVLTFQHYGNVIGAPAARLAGIRHVVANQVSAPEMISDKVALADKLLGLVGCYDLITVNTHDTAGNYKSYPERYRKLIQHVPHGFKDKQSKLTKQQAREKFGLPQDVPLIGSVARLNRIKRLDVAVDALKHDENWHLVLGGQGPAFDELNEQARLLGVSDRIHFTGEMLSDEVGDLLAAMDLFIFPSSAETFGLAAVEAAQAGLPIVANGLPVLREVLRTDLGPCALFGDIAEPESFVGPIRSLMSDQAQADALIQASKELKKLYSIDHMVDEYDRIIMEQVTPTSIEAESATA